MTSRAVAAWTSGVLAGLALAFLLLLTSPVYAIVTTETGAPSLVTLPFVAGLLVTSTLPIAVTYRRARADDVEEGGQS